VDRVVHRRLPLQTPAFRSIVDGGQRDPLCLNQRWTCRALCNSANLRKTRASASRTRRSGSFSIQNAFDNQATHRRRTDRKSFRRLVRRRLAARGAFALAVDGDAVNVTQGGHPGSRP